MGPRLIIVLLGLTAAGCTQEVLTYCNQDSDCEPNHSCNLKLHACAPVNLDMSVLPDVMPLDQRADQPVEVGADLPLPDLPLPDLPPPDLSLPDLPGVGAKCGGDSACGTAGGCVDGYCCDKPCAGLCQACNLSGKEGVCTPVPAGSDPDNECKGVKPCGGDVCNGLGACTVPAGTAKLCKSQCSSSNTAQVEEFFCDGAGGCSTSPTARTCSPYACDGAAGICAASCADNTGCVKASLCDRSLAHSTGKGVCVATAKVAVVANVKDLQDEIAMQQNKMTSRTHIRLSKGTYTHDFNWSGGVKLFLAGDKGAQLTTAYGSTAPAVVYVQDGATVTLQGIIVTGGTNQNGVACQSKTGGMAWLNLIECNLYMNTLLGVLANRCSLVARRNWIHYNDKTGVRVYEGAATLTNNLIDNNGQSLNSDPGGVDLKPNTGQAVVFANNTMVNNATTATGAVAAMRCQGVASSMPNNILYDDATTTTKALATGCSLVSSLVPTGGGTNGNLSMMAHLDSWYVPKTGLSPCIDAGQPTTATVIDRAGKPRPAVASGKVDMGCYEVQ